MAQVTLPSPQYPKSAAVATAVERLQKKEDVQEAYVGHKNRLVGALDSTKSILGDLRQFNKERWVVRYPRLAESNSMATQARLGKGLQRSLSFADDPSHTHNVILPTGLQRSMSLASVNEARDSSEESSSEEGAEESSPSASSDFQVLRLDLKLGAHGSSTGPSALVSQLEKSSIANLLDDRLRASMEHTDKLRARVEDTSSKVLVTGDLNAGKSTFVNAILKRDIMPVDQQPCTTAFCEVHDASENNGIEEVHIVKDGQTYDIHNDATFTRMAIADMENVISENENVERVIKLYVPDPRAPSESLLHNGVVDISLIDAPGLNRDSIKTTALFARQEEIDVVLFVVSAENHFTLSAKEFLTNASNEKAYLFIVVNKYEQIRDKAKCRRLVLDQIRQLSPRTYESANELVHFVDSRTAASPEGGKSESFEQLEASLRSFVLEKRAKSKLQPVATYLNNLLSDIELLASANVIVAQSELSQAQEDLARARPVLEKMKAGRDALEDGLEVIEEKGTDAARRKTKTTLSAALQRVGEGRLAVDRPLVPMPSYPGFLAVWDYARDVRKALLASLDYAVKLAEDDARTTTSKGVDMVSELAEAHLPEGVERSRRVFMPEAMFSVSRTKKNGRRQSRTVVAGGLHGLGIGLAQQPEMLDTTFFDIADIPHHFQVHFGKGKDGNNKADDDDDSNPSALSVMSLGVGALTVLGGKTIGMRGIIEGVIRLTDFLGEDSATVRKWAAPVVGAVVLGTAVYVVLELPQTIPRTVGRRIRASLEKVEPGSTEAGAVESEEELYVNAHAARVARETRKVLRLASWDLRERFRAAMEERGKEVKGAEERETKAKGAEAWFVDVGRRTGGVRDAARLMEVA